MCKVRSIYTCFSCKSAFWSAYLSSCHAHSTISYYLFIHLLTWVVPRFFLALTQMFVSVNRTYNCKNECYYLLKNTRIEAKKKWAWKVVEMCTINWIKYYINIKTAIFLRTLSPENLMWQFTPHRVTSCTAIGQVVHSLHLTIYNSILKWEVKM